MENIQKEKTEYSEKHGWVVFSGKTDLSWLRCLKKGFRHCYVLINDGKCWVSVDPMAHQTDIVVHSVPADFDLPGWFRAREHEVLPVRLSGAPKKPAPIAFFTCVEAVKRMIGLHKASVFTPWQLYQFLKSQNNEELYYG